MTAEDVEKITKKEAEPLKKDEKTETGQKKRTLRETISLVYNNITVEPIFAGIIVSSCLARIAVQNLNLDKACRVKLSLGDEICDAVIARRGDNISYYERETQKVVSSIEAWKSMIQTSIPIVIVIFMGAWSDRTGNRKRCILLPILGEILVCLSNIMSRYFFYEIPVEVTMFLEGIFPALSGGWYMAFMGVFSYISDITDEKDRTFRVGIVNLCFSAGMPIGTSLSGVLLKWLGYYGVFVIAGTILVITFTYGCFYLKDVSKPHISEEKKKQSIKCSDVALLLKETSSVAFKPREGNTRMKLIMTLVTVAIIYGPNQGENLVKYMYLRYRLNWDAVQYSLFSTYSIIIHSLSALFVLTVFSKKLGFHDSMLCIISIVSKFAGSVATAFVTSNTMMFMIPLIDILNSTTFTSLRSMASKMVTKEEMGKMNSLFSLVETFAAMIFDPCYSALYVATISVFPGTVFLFSSCMTIPPASILIWLFIQHRKELKQKRKEAIEEQRDVINEETLDEKLLESGC